VQQNRGIVAYFSLNDNTNVLVLVAVTKSGTGTWGLGHRTWDVGLGDAGTRGRGDDYYIFLIFN